MKLAALIVVVSGVMVVYLLWCKLSEIPYGSGDMHLSLVRDASLVEDHILSNGKRQRDNVTEGSWSIKWKGPSDAAPTCTYEIYDNRGVIMEKNNTKDTHISLDHKFISGVSYEINITDGTNKGQLTFNIDDTPTIEEVSGNRGSNDTRNIFVLNPNSKLYNIAPLDVYFAGDVAKNRIIAKAVVDGKEYDCDHIIGGTPSKTWSLIWETIPDIDPNTPVIINISATNHAGTARWDSMFITPA